jgi:CRP/FNR family cyclic AMP-dependent transcriptional regulator
MTSPPAASLLTDALSRHSFFHGLAPEQLARLAEVTTEVRVRAGSFVLREGGQADALYLVLEGTVALEVHVTRRAPVQVETVGPDDILGLHWLFPPRRWVLDARARDDVHLLKLDAEGLRARLEADPVLGYAVSQRLLREVYERLGRVRLQRLDVYDLAPPAQPEGGS